jgi:protein gp37
MKGSKIEWTDHTFNPWIGCTKVSPGCAHCYAEELMDHRYHKAQWGKGQPRVRTSASNWKEPLKWNRLPWICDGCGGSDVTEGERCLQCNATTRHRARVFCASLADWLDDEVPIEWLADLLARIHATPHLVWLLLTKRPQNWKDRIDRSLIYIWQEEDETGTPFSDWLQSWFLGTAPANVWIGTTVEGQTRADERLPKLFEIPAKVRFLSCEPLLGPVEIPLQLKAEFGRADFDSFGRLVMVEKLEEKIHWVICGGESGANARPMHPDWARSLRDQCSAAGVPFFFKQWGEWIYQFDAPEGRSFDGTRITPAGAQISCFGEAPKGSAEMARVGKKRAGRLLDGVEHNGFPTRA